MILSQEWSCYPMAVTIASESERGSFRRHFHLFENSIVVDRHDGIGSSLSGASHQQFSYLGGRFSDYGGNPGLEDSRFFSRDSFEGVAQQVRMIESDRRHSRHSGREHVSRIET